MLGQREGAYSTPGVESGLGSEGPERPGLQLWANGRPRKVDRAKLPATGSRRGAWPLVKKSVRPAVRANGKRGRAEPVQGATSRDRALIGGALELSARASGRTIGRTGSKWAKGARQQLSGPACSSRAPVHVTRRERNSSGVSAISCR